MSNADAAAPAKQFASWWARDIVESEYCMLSLPARALLLYLAAKSNAAFYCNPGNKLLALALGVPINPKTGERELSTVKRARRELVAAGLVQVFTGGQGPRATNGYWLAVRGLTPRAVADLKGVTDDPLSYPQGGHKRPPSNGPVVHKGVTGDPIRGSRVTPEVSSEVSRKRARLSSPPPTVTIVNGFLDDDDDWDNQ